MLRGGGGFDFVNQAALAVGAFVPGVHLVEQIVALVNDANGTFYSGRQVGARHDDGNFKQALFFWVETGHFTVDPYQVVV